MSLRPARPRRAGTRDDRPAGRGSTRGKGTRRSLRPLTPARAGGLLGMLAAGLLLRLVTSSTAFALDHVDQPSLQWTAAEAIASSVQVPTGANVFEIEVGPIERRIAALPGIASARVSVALPATLVVSVVEREAILAWRVGDTVYLVDRDGVLFAATDAAGADAAALPIVVDARVASPFTLAVGTTLDPVDFDVATRLAALTPAQIGSTATRLEVRITDTDGFLIRGYPTTWAAVFGFYSPSLRSTDIIPGQVQLLKSLLADREAAVDRIILADPRNGTYTLIATPKPTKKP